MGESSTISVLTCPACGQHSRETMPGDYCLYYYTCPACGTELTPQPGDCCVFCSYGSVPCPPVQAARATPAGGKPGNPAG